jgi:EAL domain-containing protein (putative c-di-GMP-specific phosphodiesterase class I)
VRRLKIDRTFIRDITTDDNDAAIVRAVQAMADQLGIEIVAEGIESQEQFEFLRDIGCHYGQGFWLGKPCDAENLPAVIEHRKRILS